jgi:hypothetical protein
MIAIKPGWWLEDKKLSLRGSAENYLLPRACIKPAPFDKTIKAGFHNAIP